MLEQHKNKSYLLFPLVTLFLLIGAVFLTISQSSNKQNGQSNAQTVPQDCTVASSLLTETTNERTLLSFINSYRQQNNNLPPLAWSTSLKQSAAWMSNDIKNETTLSHTDSLGRTPSDRIKACGYNQIYTAENLYYGGNTPQDVFTAWKNSAVHNANMLNASATEAGIGSEIGLGGNTYWTLDLGSSSLSPTTPIISSVPGVSPSVFPPNTVQIEFTSVVETISDSTSELKGAVHVGQVLTGWYMYNMKTADTSLSTDKIGHYLYKDPLSIMLIQSGDFHVLPYSSNTSLDIILQHNNPPYDDSYAVITEGRAWPGGIAANFINLYLSDQTRKALSNTTLTDQAPVLSQWPSALLTITGGPGHFYIKSNVTSMVKVWPKSNKPTTPTILPSGSPSGVILNSTDTQLDVTIKIPGIGSNGNKSPKHLTRFVTVGIFDPNSNQQILSGNGFLKYNGVDSFEGILHLGQLANGTYYVKVVSSNTLISQILPQFQNLTSDKVNVLPAVSLVQGDLNGDNVIDINDYNIALPCFQDKNCSNKDSIDFNDDGKVDVIDYNLLLSDFQQKKGD